MAEQVARVRLQAIVDGLEGFDQLIGAFKGLQRAIGPTEQQISRARQEIINFGNAGLASEQMIRGQIEALTALRSHAGIGGSVYRGLNSDIRELNQNLRVAQTEMRGIATQAQVMARTLNAAFGATPEVMNRQISNLRNGLSGLRYDSQQYITTLQRIKELEATQSARSGRASVIAGAEAYSGAVMNRGYGATERLPDMPDTTAALSQRLSELNDRLVNVVRYERDWIAVTHEISAVQRELNRELSQEEESLARNLALRQRVERAMAERAVMYASPGSGITRNEAGVMIAPAASGLYRNEAGVMIAGGTATAGSVFNLASRPPREISSLYQSIGEIGFSSVTNDIERMGNSFEAVAKDIRTAKMASDGSVNSLQSLRGSWNALRNTVGENSKEFREATRELEKLDRQLERTQPGGLRGKVGYIAQGVGAIASAGIFGGPEGALGGALGGGIGAILGGPPGFTAGAFLGSSIGASAGMGRQQLGQLATYAADIQKLEIALKGVTKTQGEYQQALAASASVTRDFNVPQLDATRGMTQLSAAVIGAGGKVADAEVVFRNVTAAIKASGGSAEDVQGALTAMSQIFSKGKVSAEELQGQLGERLPGAVTMFAKATGRTLPQLQKDLEQGVVGLSDLMKFITSDQGLGQFEQRAKSVAQSSAEAGARLTSTWNDTKRAIGEALLPLGAQIQDQLAGALKDATPALVAFAKALSGTVKFLADNAGLISGVLKTLLGFAAVAGVAVGVTQLTAAIASLTAGTTLLNLAMGAATGAARGLITAIAAVPGIGWIAAGVTALGLLSIELYNNNDAFKRWVDNFTNLIAQDFKNAWNDVVSIVKSAANEIAYELEVLGDWGSIAASAIDKAFSGMFSQLAENINGFWNSIPEPIRNAMSGGIDRAAAQVLAGTNPALAYLYQRGIEASRIPTAPGGRAGRELGGQGPALTQQGGLTDFRNQQQQQDERNRQQAADRARREAEQAAAEQQRLMESLAKAKIALDNAVFKNQMELIRKRYEYENELINKQRNNWVNSQTGAAKTVAGMVSQFLGEIDQLQQRMFDARQGIVTAAQELSSASAMASVTTSGLASGGRAIVGGARTGRLRDRDAEATGWDIVMPGGRGAAVQAPIALTITGTGFQGSGAGATGRGYGNWLTGKFSLGGKEYELLLGHFDRIDVAPGMQVPAGGTLGAQGITGRTFGTHVTTHVNPGRGASVADAWNALENLTQIWERGSAGTSAANIAARRDVAAEGSADVAQAGLQQSQELLKLYNEQMAKMTPEVVKSFVLSLTGDLREQNAALRDSAKVMALRNRLEAEGVRPEVIDFRVRETEATQRNVQSLRLLETLLAAAKTKVDALTAAKKTDTDEYRAAQMQVTGYTQGIAELNANFNENIKLTREATAAQIAFNDSMRFRQDNRIGLGLKEGAQQYVESIGTMREATAQLSQTGIKGVEDAIFSLATTGKANFQEFAVEILNQTTRMVIQQLILRSIMQAVGFLNPSGNAANTLSGLINPATAANGAVVHNGIQPFAMGGIVTKPTMFRYGNGGVPGLGVMGEAGPEAIVPLRRGRDGKLGIAGGGGTVNVTVNVDATGSQVQGNTGQGEALGRVVSQAVQAELIKQRRPGGILAS